MFLMVDNESRGGELDKDSFFIEIILSNCQMNRRSGICFEGEGIIRRNTEVSVIFGVLTFQGQSTFKPSSLSKSNHKLFF